MSEPRRFGKIMVAFDGSADSAKATEIACSLAKQYGSEVVIVHVYHFPMYYLGTPAPGALPDFESLEKTARERGVGILEKGLRIAKESGVDARSELLQAASIVQALVEFSENEKAELIITGTRGTTGFKRLLMGSVSTGLVSHARCPVMVVR